MILIYGLKNFFHKNIFKTYMVLKKLSKK